MKYIILGHENPDVDSFISGVLLERIMKKKGYEVSFAIPDKTLDKESELLCNKYDLYLGKYMVDELDSEAKYILVDHNDREVPGEIVAILDHHPTPKDKSNIPYYKNEIISSTAILIARLCEEELDKEDIELVCLATLVDTVSFHSSKTVKSDISWVHEKCDRYELEYEEMYRDGLCLTDLTDINDIAYNGLKKYDYDGFNMASSYIQVASIEKSQDTIDVILEKLREYVVKDKLDLFVFIVYDMSTFYTKVYKIDKKDINYDEYFLYASRGNTIIPDIVKKYCKK